MVVAVYVSALVFACCAVWLIVVSTGLMPTQSPSPDGIDLSWRRIWPSILGSAASAATFLILRFVQAEAPVSASVVIRGWLGLFCIVGIVSAASAGLMRVMAAGVRNARRRRGQAPSAR